LSKLDLSKGFHQVVIEDSSRDLTTFVCPFERFCFQRMQFGLKKAVFQALMEKVLSSCKDLHAVYIDGILVFSNFWSEHLCHIEMVLQSLRQAGLTAKPVKCQWGHSQRAAAMAEFRRPITRKDLRSFLGSVGYYRRFFPDFAKCFTIITPATSIKGPNTIQWTPEKMDAFSKLCQSLCDLSLNCTI